MGVGQIIAIVVLVVDVVLLVLGREPLVDGALIGGLAIARLT